ncbi:hypothetical protein FJZ17_00200 [Candidatus Pacearchaeota archaeon]|nr:hypothetical protein [Candidatus Pacearchaeota archaeon]
MVKKGEVGVIIGAIILMTLLLSFNKGQLIVSTLLNSLVISIVVILTSIICKKLVAKKIDTEIEFKFWALSRFWITRRAYLKRPVTMGLILPLLIAFLSRGFVKFLTILEFNIKALPAKAAKKYGKHRFTNINDWDEALIIFYSLVGLLIVSIVTDFFNYSLLQGISKWALYYAAYSLVPLGSLDGTKLLFASKPLYAFSAILIAIISLIILP